MRGCWVFVPACIRELKKKKKKSGEGCAELWEQSSCQMGRTRLLLDHGSCGILWLTGGCSVGKHPLCRNILDSCAVQPYGNIYLLIVQKIQTCFNCIKAPAKLKYLIILYSQKETNQGKKPKNIKETYTHKFKKRMSFLYYF